MDFLIYRILHNNCGFIFRISAIRMGESGMKGLKGKVGIVASAGALMRD
jgi:hypothetical protein